MFVIPTLDECLQRVRQSFRAHLPSTDAWLWPNNINPTAKVVGASASDLFQRIDYVGRQAFVLFAEKDALEDHGADYGITRRPAAPASGTLLATAPDAVAFANGAQFLRSDGVIVTAAIGGGLSAAGTLSLAVIAATKALATNSQPGTAFTILSGASGPGASGVAIVADAAGLTGGLDVEPDGAPRTTDLGTLRGRILFRKRNPPQGGAPADYVQWASSVPGVTRVFVERLFAGPGTVRVFPLFDSLFAATGGIADDAHIALVRNAIAAVQPATAEVVVTAPAALPIPVAIQGLQPSTSPVRAAVAAELADTFQRLGQVAGADTPLPSLPFLATPFSFAAIWIDQAVANATGEKRAIVVTPPADVPVPSGSIPVLSGPTFG